MKARVNVFVSHRWNQDWDEAKQIKEWLREDSYYDFKMFDIEKHEAESEGLSETIRNRIKASNIFICFNNQSYSYSSGKTWMRFELNRAKDWDIPILVIKKQGTYEIPEELKEFPQVAWNSNSIREAIKEHKK